MIAEEKIHQHFAGFVVRKDLSKLVKGNALEVLDHVIFCRNDFYSFLDNKEM